jgi:hypothetical protein
LTYYNPLSRPLTTLELAMALAAVQPAKLQHTVIDPSVRMRETHIGQQCEILAESYLEYSELGVFFLPRRALLCR